MAIAKWAEKTLNIAGPAGQINARLGQSRFDLESGGKRSRSGFIMCHPHPLFAGTMDNKVVTTLVRAASRLPVAVNSRHDAEYLDTIRFNFRGVGESEGEFDHGKGEQNDLAAIITYAVEVLGWETLYLAGFSFGSGVACLYANNQTQQYAAKIAGLFLVAPAVHHFAAPATLPFEFETHVYMGDADEVVPFDEVEHWVSLLVPQPHYHVFEEGDHFFHGRLAELKAAFIDDLERCLVFK